jgi:hypothetical protein
MENANTPGAPGSSLTLPGLCAGNDAVFRLWKCMFFAAIYYESV